VDGDPRGTGGGAGVQTLAVPAVTALQEAYARKVVETVGDLDNILYEITNEAIADAPTAAWHNHMIGYLKGLQAAGPHRRPVGMTGGFRPDVASVNAQLLESGADWISLAGHVPRDREEPPAAPQGRISVLDTDHVFGIGGDALWVWKAFSKGHNVIYMDAMIGLGMGGLMIGVLEEARAAAQRSGRRGIAGTRAAALLLGDMAGVAPRGDLCSTGYALADPGRGVYVALAPAGGGFTLDLSGAFQGRQRLAAHWIEVETGTVRHGGQVEGGGGAAPRVFDPPFAPAALVLTPPSP